MAKNFEAGKRVGGIIGHFFAKVERSQVLFCYFAEAKFSAWNLFKLASYGKFSFSRPDLDGNKLAKGTCA